jgi:hypothetical protein
MTLYIIRGHIVTAFASAPATSEDELRVRSVEEVEGSGLSAAQMVAIWNALPGAKPLSKFKDRKTAARRLWAAFGNLPVAAEPTAPGASGSRAGSKQAQVIGLLQRPEGATIEEMAIAMGWQRHTVRGMISGALKKKLGLEILSEPTDRGRLYRIAESRPTLP